MIDTPSALAAFVLEVEAADWVALDTEADSLYSYPEKLCLLQISLPGRDELVDPLAELELSDLLEALRSHCPILHGADYDLRLLYRSLGFVPQSIFDTMMAAQLVGYSELGLNALAQKILGIRLEKGPQRANWARRPLTTRMAQYARNDTRYLKPIADHLRAKLDTLGRLEWHAESCARLVRECGRAAPPASDRDWRLKGASRLDRRGLAVLRQLCQWRLGEALRVARPPYFILPHETLVALADAASQPKKIEALLPRRIASARRRAIVRAIQAALDSPPATWPDHDRRSGRDLTPAQKSRYDELRRRRDHHAATLGIDPTLIASRNTLQALAHDWKAHEPRLLRWQRRLLETEATEHAAARGSPTPGCHPKETTSKAKPFRYSVSGTDGSTG